MSSILGQQMVKFALSEGQQDRGYQNR